MVVFHGSRAGGFELTYDTPITSDVEGHLSESDVTDLLTRIEDLPTA